MKVTFGYVQKFIEAVADGYDWSIIELVDEGDGEIYFYIITDNPDYMPDNGSDPKMSLEINSD